MKAQGMSIGVVITAALAVMVLLMVGGFMSGGFSALTGKITGFVGSGPSAEETGKAAGCSAACTAWKAANCPASGIKTVAKACLAAAAPAPAPAAIAAMTGMAVGTYEDKSPLYGCGSSNDKVDGIITCGTCKCDLSKGGAWGK